MGEHVDKREQVKAIYGIEADEDFDMHDKET
jgi:hypothetical protein